MSSYITYLLLGSNLKDRNKNLILAQEAISQEVGEVISYTEIIETEPIGFESENAFLNQLLKVETQLSPIHLLNRTQHIEKKIGRTSKTLADKYQDRIIDIDILLFENLNFKSNRLNLPHINNVENRAFVKELFSKLL